MPPARSPRTISRRALASPRLIVRTPARTRNVEIRRIEAVVVDPPGHHVQRIPELRDGRREQLPVPYMAGNGYDAATHCKSSLQVIDPLDRDKLTAAGAGRAAIVPARRRNGRRYGMPPGPDARAFLPPAPEMPWRDARAPVACLDRARGTPRHPRHRRRAPPRTGGESRAHFRPPRSDVRAPGCAQL